MKLAGVLLAALPFTAAISFTGNAPRDFQDNLARGDFVVVITEDPSGAPDVGVPSQIDDDISGWDINEIFWQWNPDQDSLHIGIDCYVVCGDADGNGNPDGSSSELEGIGGEDTADLSGSESFAISIDWTTQGRASGDFSPETIIGIPGGNPATGGTLPCAGGADDFSMSSCFGLYRHAGLSNSVAPAFQFASPMSVTTVNRNPSPSSARPDLEWTIEGVVQLKDDLGNPFGDPREEWGFDINAFAGSFVDAGIGEDYIPDQFGSVPVDFPCQGFDVCDICLGDGSSCQDCLGVPNGPNDYDLCDVCAGDNTACADCAGVPNGNAQYDNCGICNGDGSTCIPDCLNVPGGNADYDICGVCNGDGTSCRDCRGIPFGPNEYDECDVCAGDGTSCIPDCLNVPGGNAQYDICGVCAGDGSSCEDCRGIPLGPNVYDVCGVCAGDGTSCLDCAGVPNGNGEYDECGVCNGNSDTCLDCLGVPNGRARYDACGICAGDGSTCADCRGVPNGGAVYDICDVCGGNGRSCLDCAGEPFGLAVEDECGVCNGDGLSCIETYFGEPAVPGAGVPHPAPARRYREAGHRDASEEEHIEELIMRMGGRARGARAASLRTPLAPKPKLNKKGVDYETLIERDREAAYQNKLRRSLN